MSTTTTLGLRPDLALTIPLLSSSLTVFYAMMEGAVFRSFQQAAKKDPAATAKVMRSWWNAFLGEFCGSPKTAPLLQDFISSVMRGAG